jgi:hypothetical protein
MKANGDSHIVSATKQGHPQFGRPPENLIGFPTHPTHLEPGQNGIRGHPYFGHAANLAFTVVTPDSHLHNYLSLRKFCNTLQISAHRTRGGNRRDRRFRSTDELHTQILTKQDTVAKKCGGSLVFQFIRAHA